MNWATDIIVTNHSSTLVIGCITRKRDHSCCQSLSRCYLMKEIWKMYYFQR